MKRITATLLIPLWLASCGGGSNPFEDDGTGTGTPTTPGSTSGIPASLANDLSRFSYNAAAGTLTVEGLSLDAVPFSATYVRKPGLDVAGYEAYTAQDDPLDRHATAFVAQTRNEGAVRAGVTSTGGPRNRFFAGGYYERDGGYTPPPVTATSGLVTYAGRYVGLTNLNGSGEDLLPVPPGTPGELIPDQAAEVTGDAFIQVDFGDNVIEGNVINRQLADTATGLPSIVLVATDIAADGTFFGSRVEYQGVLTTDIGDYGGIFGGTNASGVGGVVHLTQFDGVGDTVLGTDFEEEFGVFVLDQCGQPVEDPVLCASAKP